MYLILINLISINDDYEILKLVVMKNLIFD